MKVLVVDDHPLVLSGCRALLSETGDMEMIEAENAATAYELYRSCHPDVAVIDINLPDISGFELVRRLLKRDPKARLMMFSMNNDPIFVAEALHAGVKGYIAKTDPPDQFTAAIRTVYAGGRSLAPEMAQAVVLARANSDESTPLSLREREVLRLLASGRSLAEAAARISVSYKTVKVICTALREKFDAETLAELIRIAVERHLV